MEKNIAISLINVSKLFNIPKDRQYGLKGTILNIIRGKWGSKTFYALKNITLDVNKGEFLGIIGRNGAGKSTLLRIIAGILKPTSGLVKVNGKIASFLELGLGFQGELKGKENVYQYGAMLGLKKQDIDKKYPKIVRFSGLQRFMYMKLKNYSSGMQARLAFSIATQTDADILLVDEVLAVGDSDFQKKCIAYFAKIKGKKTVLLVSHKMDRVNKFCDRIIRLDVNLLVKHK